MRFILLFFILVAQLGAQDFSKIPLNPQGKNTVGLIHIDDRETSISQATWLYVKQALDYYKKEKPNFIILHMNTPGGEVFAAQKIADALKEMDIQEGIPIITFIDNWAISAGALIAYSTRYIVVSKDAAMGAAEPLTVQGETTEVASEKVNSAMRADFANRARFFGRNPLLAEAMVDKDLILVMRGGVITKLDNSDEIQKTDKIITPKGKLLTLDAEQLMEYKVADLLLQPQKLDPVGTQEREKGVWPASKNLLFTAPFFATIPNAEINEYQMDWKTRFLAFLANPAVSSVLFLGLMLGLYMEMSSPGFGLPGTIALISLFLIALSSFALEIAGYLELILLLTGLAILLVELLILPTFGLLGFIGLLLFLAGLLAMLLPGLKNFEFEWDTQTVNAAGETLINRLAWLSAAFLVGIGILYLLAPSLGKYSRLVLQGNEQEGYIAGESPQFLPEVGSEGEAWTPLRPAGKVMFNDQLYDALSAGEYIEKGDPIFVDRLEGSTLIVRRKST